MPTGLVRHHHTGALRFLTFCCYRKLPILGYPQARDTFLETLEQTRAKHDFAVAGYIVMPNHVHMLLSESALVPLSTSMQVIKQRFSRTRPEEYVWEPRYHDFNVFTEDKRAEKLHYIHQNPVRRGLAPTPADWPWSSFRSYTQNLPTPVQRAHSTL
jgi:putative transposase